MIPESTDSGFVAAAAPLRWRALLGLLARLPQGAISRLTGRLADLRVPVPLRNRVYGAFARAAGIDTGEMAGSFESFETLDGFFTRTLRAGARTWPADASLIVSPVDGVVGQCGPIETGRLLQAKGRAYSAAALLADDDAHAFDGGSFVTLYLSPRHYHRVHAPCTLEVIAARRVPGALMPVNGPAIATVADLFPTNERLICMANCETGRIGIVAVGAFNVGRITASFDDSLVTNVPQTGLLERTCDPARRVERGEEMMVFHLGSTVVMLFERGRVQLAEDLVAGAEIRLGQTLARPADR